jgi:hypothetical protein
MNSSIPKTKSNCRNVLRCLLSVVLVGGVVVTQLKKSISMTSLFSTSIMSNSYSYDEGIWYPSMQNLDVVDLSPAANIKGSERRSSVETAQKPIINDTARSEELIFDEFNRNSSSLIPFSSHNQFNKSNISSGAAITTSPSSDIHQNRTLVIVLGNVRGGEPAWRSMCQHLLDANSADLALLIGEGDPNSPKATTLLHERAKFIWSVPEYDDWADAMEDIPNKPTDWRDRLFSMVDPSRVGNILLGAAHNITGSGALVFMFRFYLSQKLQEYNLLRQYDRFVVTRSDHFYLCVHDLSKLSNEFLWVPTGSDYFGICDRHFIASNRTILAALDILPPLVRNPELYKEQIKTYPYNTERFLLLRWQQEGLSHLIQRFDRNLFLVAGNADDTRWKPKGRYIQGLDVYLKYSQEYLESRKTCNGRNRKRQAPLRSNNKVALKVKH